MAQLCPETNEIIYQCSKCPALHNKTVKLWRKTCEWGSNVELMCRWCTEDYCGEKLTDSSGPTINRMLPAILEDDKQGFVSFSMRYSFPKGYSQWADLPEK